MSGLASIGRGMASVVVGVGLLAGSAMAAEQAAVVPVEKTSWKFNFSGTARSGFQTVLPTSVYATNTGFGFDFGKDSGKTVTRYTAKMDGIEAVPSGKNTHNWTGLPFYAPAREAFFFSANVPRGNYEVKITLGSVDTAVRATIRAEQRRLMIEDWQIPAGQAQARTIHVNRRSTAIAGTSNASSMTAREATYVDLDNRLTIEINGNHPVIDALEITKIDTGITVYLAGNSTVVDQSQEPWGSWGQNFPRFFKPGVAISDQAESGLSAASFLAGRRLDNIVSTLKAGDYVFVEFGHNDQKSTSATPLLDYRNNLVKFVTAVKAKNATPVLVTPTARLSFTGTTANNTLDAYPDTVRSVAKQQGVPMFDLNAMSSRLIEALGPSNASKAYCYFPANTVDSQTTALKDGTHWNSYGGYELAKAMATEVKKQNLSFAKFLSDDYVAFDPSSPDAYAAFALPFSPFLGTYATPDSAVYVPVRIAGGVVGVGESRIASASLQGGTLSLRLTGDEDGLEVRVLDMDGSLVSMTSLTGRSTGERQIVAPHGFSHRIHLVQLVKAGQVVDQRKVGP